MDTSEMQELFRGYLGELNWPGVTKDDLLRHLSGRDDALRTMVNEYVTEGAYADLQQVMSVIPVQAWQDAQGDTWRGPDSLDPDDVESGFNQGAVGQDASTAQSTSGSIMGSTATSDPRTAAFGGAGSNSGEVDPGVTIG